MFASLYHFREEEEEKTPHPCHIICSRERGRRLSKRKTVNVKYM